VPLDQLRPLARQPRQAAEHDALRQLGLAQRQRRRLAVVGIRIEAAQVRVPPRLVAVAGHGQRRVQLAGSRTLARKPGGLGHRLRHPTEPSI
jgi:hypothetical protein